MSIDLKLGELITTDQPRDAVHIAIIPVTAGEGLRSGQHVGVAGGQATSATPHVGVIDPFLRANVAKGERCWMFLFPNTITSLRHQWAHPAFPVETPVESKELLSYVRVQEGSLANDSEVWLREFAVKHEIDFDDLMEAVVGDEYYVFHDNDRTDGESLRDSIVDAIESQKNEFWQHVTVVTGKTFSEDHKDNTYFGCSC